MAKLHLPVKYTDHDVALAGALAQLLHSEALYVAWSSESGPAEPVVTAKLVVTSRDEVEPSSRPRGLVARLLARRRRR